MCPYWSITSVSTMTVRFDLRANARRFTAWPLLNDTTAGEFGVKDTLRAAGDVGGDLLFIGKGVDGELDAAINW